MRDFSVLSNAKNSKKILNMKNVRIKMTCRDCKHFKRETKDSGLCTNPKMKEEDYPNEHIKDNFWCSLFQIKGV